AAWESISVQALAPFALFSADEATCGSDLGAIISHFAAYGVAGWRVGGPDVAVVGEHHGTRCPPVRVIFDAPVVSLVAGRADVVGVAELAGGVQVIGVRPAQVSGLPLEGVAG